MRTVLSLLLILSALPASAAEIVLAPVAAGDDVRLACEDDPDFLAGTDSGAVQLYVGGTAYSCDREWATSCEFDLTTLPADLVLESAVFTVRQTGYADDAPGLFYMACFAYEATGTPVPVLRDDLNPQTALGVLWLSPVSGDRSFTVTDTVQDALDDGFDRVGLLLAGVYSEAGYEDWITVGGAAHGQPPRLTLTYSGVVGDEAWAWSGVKRLFR